MIYISPEIACKVAWPFEVILYSRLMTHSLWPIGEKDIFLLNDTDQFGHEKYVWLGPTFYRCVKSQALVLRVSF